MPRSGADTDDSLFETLDRPVKIRGCDCPGCVEPGHYRAPKSRALDAYYMFCLDHVREYNAAWDYFAGMSGPEIEAQIRKATVWDRPSWPMGEYRRREEELREAIMREFFEEAAHEQTPPPMAQIERDALAALELYPPVDFEAIKAKYRALVKRHHPDANGGSVASEEKFKNISQAFAILRKIYGEETED